MTVFYDVVLERFVELPAFDETEPGDEGASPDDVAKYRADTQLVVRSGWRRRMACPRCLGLHLFGRRCS